jgi:predicted patatin/cPLA2 family phospholipase
VKHGDELAEAHTRASDDRLRESMGAQHAEAYLSGQPPLRDTVQYAAENPGE